MTKPNPSVVYTVPVKRGDETLHVPEWEVPMRIPVRYGNRVLDGVTKLDPLNERGGMGMNGVYQVGNGLATQDHPHLLGGSSAAVSARTGTTQAGSTGGGWLVWGFVAFVVILAIVMNV